MKENTKRNRQLIRDSIHLPFYERINNRNTSTANSSDIDPNEQIISHVLAHEDKITLDEQIVEKCRAAFSKFDKNGDGQIDTHELTEALLCMFLFFFFATSDSETCICLFVAMGYNPSPEELTEIMNDVDQNGDNCLDFLEFMRVIQRQKNKTGAVLSDKEKNEINIKEAWKTLSDNKTGKMNVVTFKTTLKSFDLAIDIDALIKVLDIDHSGYVDFDEFHGLFTESQ